MYTLKDSRVFNLGIVAHPEVTIAQRISIRVLSHYALAPIFLKSLKLGFQSSSSRDTTIVIAGQNS